MCVAWLPVLVRWGPAPFTVTFDDAYYYFAIARHLAEGHGSSFDGINLTNGYHPLWLAVCTLPYLLGLAGLAAVRAVLVLQLGVWAATLWIVATIEANAIDRFPRLELNALLQRGQDLRRQCRRRRAGAQADGGLGQPAHVDQLV